jgi:hypothetical protein
LTARSDTRFAERTEERVREILLLELDPPSGEELTDGRNEPARRLHDLEAE